MAEQSMFWTTGGAGDGATTYTQSQVFAWMRRMLIGRSATSEGILAGFANELAASGVATPVSVNTGAAIVYGIPYENDTAVTVAIPTPSAGNSRYDRLVLRASWSAQTVRITRIAGAESTGAPIIPAMTQTANTIWDIPLVTLLVTAAGVITHTDNRSFAHFNTRVSSPMIDAGAVGAVALASGAAVANLGYTPANSTQLGGKTVQSGTLNVAGAFPGSSSTASQTFPTAYSATPIVVATPQSSNDAQTITLTSITSTGFSVKVVNNTGSAGVSITMQWIAIG